MELVIRVAGLALVVAVWLALLRGRLPEYALGLILAFGVVALGAALGPLSEAVRLLGRLAELAGTAGSYLGIVLRAVAIAYVAGLSAQFCRDAGQEGVAATVELVGKVAVLLVALPVFVTLLDSLWRLLPGSLSTP